MCISYYSIKNIFHSNQQCGLLEKKNTNSFNKLKSSKTRTKCHQSPIKIPQQKSSKEGEVKIKKSSVGARNMQNR